MIPKNNIELNLQKHEITVNGSKEEIIKDNLTKPMILAILEEFKTWFNLTFLLVLLVICR